MSTTEAGHERRTRLIAQALERHGPAAGETFPCPYLPGRPARNVTLVPSPLVAGVYHSLMDLNFRRLGPVFYRPQCEGCQECRMIRVAVDAFRPSRAQKRCRRRNQDVTVEVGPPRPSEEKRRLYQRYLEGRHDGQMDGSPEEFEGFLYTSPLETIELVYRLDGRLLGAALADVEPQALSAVYCYFDPDEGRRSLGVFSVLQLIAESRRRARPYLYLGYFVADCAKMAYKAGYRPSEILGGDGTWAPLTAASRTSG